MLSPYPLAVTEPPEHWPLPQEAKPLSADGVWGFEIALFVTFI